MPVGWAWIAYGDELSDGLQLWRQEAHHSPTPHCHETYETVRALRTYHHISCDFTYCNSCPLHSPNLLARSTFLLSISCLCRRVSSHALFLFPFCVQALLACSLLRSFFVQIFLAYSHPLFFLCKSLAGMLSLNRLDSCTDALSALRQAGIGQPTRAHQTGTMGWIVGAQIL